SRATTSWAVLSETPRPGAWAASRASAAGSRPRSWPSSSLASRRRCSRSGCAGSAEAIVNHLPDGSTVRVRSSTGGWRSADQTSSGVGGRPDLRTRRGPGRAEKNTMPARLGSLPRVSRRRTAQPEGMTELIWSFAPWLTFLLATWVTSFYGAVAVGVAAAVAGVHRASPRHRLPLLGGAGLVFFAGLGVILLAVHPAHVGTWARYAQAGSHTALTLIVFGSILVGHPFNEDYRPERTQ